LQIAHFPFSAPPVPSFVLVLGPTAERTFRKQIHLTTAPLVPHYLSREIVSILSALPRIFKSMNSTYDLDLIISASIANVDVKDSSMLP
jgi:hypothetical protein